MKDDSILYGEKKSIQLSTNFGKVRGQNVWHSFYCVFFIFNLKFTWWNSHHDTSLRLKLSWIFFCKNLFKGFNESQYKMERKTYTMLNM